jgi:hypothetical protein
MSVLISAMTSFVVMSGILAQARSDEEQVRKTVKAFRQRRHRGAALQGDSR